MTTSAALFTCVTAFIKALPHIKPSAVALAPVAHRDRLYRGSAWPKRGLTRLISSRAELLCPDNRRSECRVPLAAFLPVSSTFPVGQTTWSPVWSHVLPAVLTLLGQLCFPPAPVLGDRWAAYSSQQAPSPALGLWECCAASVSGLCEILVSGCERKISV